MGGMTKGKWELGHTKAGTSWGVKRRERGSRGTTYVHEWRIKYMGHMEM